MLTMTLSLSHAHGCGLSKLHERGLMLNPNSLDGAAILVTGGTGSFGQAFIRHVFAKHRPSRVVAYSRDELKQWDMQQVFNPPQMRYFIGDIRDRERLERALQGIDVVVHAAALKQVPAAEYNPIECIKTNVIGSENVINACLNQHVKKVIALSTDKAVNPLNLYGATKLCADKLFVAANHLSKPGGTHFAVVRYGNVIGSRGSVVPLFKKLRKTGRLPVTDARMTRFWIRIEDGAAFVDHCIGLMRGGEIFVPKIPSMKISDLATAIGPECEHEIVGIRPGEKLHELLIARDDSRQTIEFSDFFVIQPAIRMWASEEPMAYGSEKGVPVDETFEYGSDSNTRWISADELKQIIE
jgi:UDP-N-acetylglucosamine 4,6-dehydratase/5-epimerase